MFGAFGHFHTYGKGNCDHPYPETRFATETKRLLKILNERFLDRDYIAGSEYSIADISIFPWVIWLDMFYKASVRLELESFTNVTTWLRRCCSRPATIRGFDIYGFTEIGK